MNKPSAERCADLTMRLRAFADHFLHGGKPVIHIPPQPTDHDILCVDAANALLDLGADRARLQTAYDAQCAELAAMRAERDEARERLEAIRKDIELPVVEATSEFGPENLEELIACVSKQGKGGNYCLDPDEIVAGRDELRSMCNALRLAWQQRDAARADVGRIRKDLADAIQRFDADYRIPGESVIGAVRRLLTKPAGEGEAP